MVNFLAKTSDNFKFLSLLWKDKLISVIWTLGAQIICQRLTEFSQFFQQEYLVHYPIIMYNILE